MAHVIVWVRSHFHFAVIDGETAGQCCRLSNFHITWSRTKIIDQLESVFVKVKIMYSTKMKKQSGVHETKSIKMVYSRE